MAGSLDLRSSVSLSVILSFSIRSILVLSLANSDKQPQATLWMPSQGMYSNWTSTGMHLSSLITIPLCGSRPSWCRAPTVPSIISSIGTSSIMALSIPCCWAC
ncbi:hypothetical protein BpHYR1_019474 [Brachionus plicatilis]|uniref:Uncharacterized protein n=1 Tax=Brachionus plicatilis TaxID=10195 RepID=A0A3M7RC33_BRAPC|nr:hypothetical protein BpHYR1_019474 [Brachionus plicatilis]